MKAASPVGGEGHQPDQFWPSSSASNNAHSFWTSEAVCGGQGRKIGPKHFHRNAIHSSVLNASSHHDFVTSSRCDPSSDELSPNRSSFRGARVGHYVWNQVYKGGLSLPSPCVQLGHAQLLG